MATMLVYLLTDAPIDKTSMQTILKRVIDKTFNCISIDSDMSTSDTVIAIRHRTYEFVWSDNGILDLVSTI